MARFLLLLVAVAAAAAVLSQLGDAAPSTAEVFWRAVLPESPLPDAFLRLLRPGAEQRQRHRGVDDGARRRHGRHDDGVLPRGGGARRRKAPVLLPGRRRRGRWGFLPRRGRGLHPVHGGRAAGRPRRCSASRRNTAEAAGMRETLRTCEWPTLAGESKFCATSLEALVEGAMAALGTRDIAALASTLPRGGAPLQAYAVRAVLPVEGAGFVACHDQAYPYTVYRCHTTGPARAYMVEMEGDGGGDGGEAVTVATVCHTNTSRWNPEHVSFKLLGTKPGGSPVCHLMPYGHIVWAKNVKSSTA
ncbi:hypothetical protein OsJ_27805 [Oryza sativa Japonica Group]|uniref:BURP domain-containing protein n=1 Tax=Oryza sativa subsp. japonica TaxID=39947 RepID=A3BUG7_ORYSJ|nr:hypothetical protein OsJ_27805 [Oryza sativa Japonica Group]